MADLNRHSYQCSSVWMNMQNISPPVLLSYLREHRSEWADSDIDAYSAAAVKAAPRTSPASDCGSSVGPVILTLVPALCHEEVSYPYCFSIHGHPIVINFSMFDIFLFILFSSTWRWLSWKVFVINRKLLFHVSCTSCRSIFCSLFSILIAKGNMLVIYVDACFENILCKFSILYDVRVFMKVCISEFGQLL